MVLICLFLSSFSPSRFPSSPSLTVSHSRPLPCPDFHSHSLPPAIFLPLELSLSCLFPLPSSSPSSFVFHIPSASSSGLSISSGPSISPLLLLLGAILLCSRCSARRKYSLFAPPPPPALRRSHQTPFYARGLLKNIAVSENAPGAHGDVPRAQGVPRARSIP